MAESLEAVRAALAERYDVEREIGRGGMATVYLAQDGKHRRPVAIKVLRAEIAAELGADRFLREIETVAGLTHPHILPLHDSGFMAIAGEAEPRPYYVMPYVPGETLRDRLGREGALPLEDALRIAREVSSALAHAHAAGVVHRDIKPANILLSGGHAVVADFGIARAISAARERQRDAGSPPESGMSVGTPAYMSPEQVIGSARLDGRSDIYSLGCVLYEMLAGRPPFEGASAAEIAAAHVADPPPPLVDSGRVIPAEVERVMLTALAKNPADRFATAHQMAEALPVVVSHRASGGISASSEAAESPAPARKLRKRALLGIAVIVVSLLGAFVAAPRFRVDHSVDQGLYVVLPFAHRAEAAPELLSGDNCESLLYDGLSRWRDVRLVNALVLHDAKARLGDSASSFESGLEIAHELRAGRLVWGEVWQVRDTTYVRAALYDVARRGAVLREATVKLGALDADLGATFNALADSLVIGGGGAPLAVAGAAGTDRVDAWRAYQAGHSALDRWDLPMATRQFELATQRDPDYSHAHLWLAQVASWQGRPAAEWRQHAAAALGSTHPLGPHDSAVARGLVAIGESRFDEACREFDGLISRDSMDVNALLGRAECLSRDGLVVRDARSRSGWRFRSSYHAAQQTYRRVLQLVPSTYSAHRGAAFQQLAARLFTQPGTRRFGYALAPDSVRFAGRPSLDHDTLAFVPYPYDSLVRGSVSREIIEAEFAAVERNRAILGEIGAAWARAFPRSPDALRAYGASLELQGVLRGRQSTEPSALETYRAGMAASRQSDERVRLAADVARVLLKLGAYDSARMFADSVLATTQEHDPHSAVHLAGMAALIGRVGRTVELLRRSTSGYRPYGPDGSVTTVPAPLGEAALALLGYAAFGEPEDSIRSSGQRLAQLTDAWVEPDRRVKLSFAAFSGPVALAFPALRRSTLHEATSPDYLLRMQSDALRRDSSSVRRTLAQIREVRKGIRPGAVMVDRVYQEASLSLTIGDTAYAVQSLDQLLGAIGTLNLDLLGEDPMMSVPQAAGLVRSMALRAQLAAIAGDDRTARQWAKCVVALWGGADPTLQTLVGRMRTLAR